MSGLSPLAATSCSAENSSSKNSPPRMSITTATRRTLPSECRQRSANLGSSAGGRLSTQKKPRSSKTFMTLDFPAPESPVIMTNWNQPSPRRGCLSRAPAAMPLPPREVAEAGADDGDQQRPEERREE